MFELLSLGAPDVVWLVDPMTTTVLDCSEAAVALMRCGSRDHLVGRRLEELLPPMQRSNGPTTESTRKIAEWLKDGNSKFEWTSQRFDGTEVRLEVSATMIQRDGERVTVLWSRDISEQKDLVRSKEQLKQAEAELRESESRRHESEERFSDEKFVAANDAFAGWYGRRRDEIIGHDTKELNTSLNLEDHAKFWAELKRKLVETELLRTLAREKELGQLRSHIVSMVSHEFRTPLGIIQSSAEILEDYFDELKPAERKEYLQSIQKNTRRIARLIEEALLLASLDAGKIEFKPAPLDLRTFAEKLVDEVLSATAQRCSIELSLGELPAEPRADERLLQHILTNLLINAVRYSDPGKTVQFEIKRDGSEIVFTIRDQGIGIPEADRKWLFSAFHRGHNVDDRPGTGLGLVIVKRCVDLHCAKIKVVSRLGEGTVVTVKLPLLTPESPVAIRRVHP